MKQASKILVLSTRNAHKVQEIRALLSDGFLYRTLDDFPGAPRVNEDATTFSGNAAKKAVELALWLSANPEAVQHIELAAPEGAVLVLADDSGLEVDALNGAPGVHSARFAAVDEGTAGNSTDAANNAKLLRLLKDVPWEKRSARFRCVIAVAVVPSLASPVSRHCEKSTNAELQAELFDGACEGRIGFEAKGNAGFGYDPLFFPLGFDQTFAELGEATKNQFSHRAKALLKLRESLRVGPPRGRPNELNWNRL